MLTPEYLDDIGNAAIELYTELDERIARDIARRLVKSGAVTSTAQWQALMMQESGVQIGSGVCDGRMGHRRRAGPAWRIRDGI